MTPAIHHPFLAALIALATVLILIVLTDRRNYW